MIIPPPQFTGTIRRTRYSEDWCCYSHEVDGEIIFIGECLLKEYLSYPDARQNSEWNKLTRDDPEIITRVHIVSPSRNEVMSFKFAYIRNNGHPPCNKAGHRVAPAKPKIRCMQDGKIFDTQLEVAKFYGLNQGSLSRHLRGHPSNRSVGGLTFHQTYATDDEDG